MIISISSKASSLNIKKKISDFIMYVHNNMNNFLGALQMDCYKEGGNGFEPEMTVYKMHIILRKDISHYINEYKNMFNYLKLINGKNLFIGDISINSRFLNNPDNIQVIDRIIKIME